jgi:adenylate cyclase
MHIKKQKGFVSTLNMVSSNGSKDYTKLRSVILAKAEKMSNLSPENQIDEYDESILTFKTHLQALSFLVNIFRTAVTLGKDTQTNFNLKSSLCSGEYFVHQKQIYGDAVNLATRLSCTSRENELLVCGVDIQIIKAFVDSQKNVTYCLRNPDQNCVVIHLLDEDPTHRMVENEVLKIECNHKSRAFTSARNQRIVIGRAKDSDIVIDGDDISRHHATIKLNYGSIFIEDHSANGTYLYVDNREMFVANDSKKLISDGYISCGHDRQAGKGRSDIISYSLCGEADLANEAQNVC